MKIGTRLSLDAQHVLEYCCSCVNLHGLNCYGVPRSQKALEARRMLIEDEGGPLVTSCK